MILLYGMGLLGLLLVVVGIVLAVTAVDDKLDDLIAEADELEEVDRG